ncbi:MAG: hypothetical protein LWW90_05115 [Candidatus Desulfofervidus auxilii]|nr:hypothetical protein [Candidatus Desulfofervidus auxilii]
MQLVLKGEISHEIIARDIIIALIIVIVFRKLPKRMAIRSTVRRTFLEFWNHVSTYQSTTNCSLDDAARYVLTNVYYVPDKAVDEIFRLNPSNKIRSALMHLAVQQVFKELGYDPTIGTQEDFALIAETSLDCWTGWQKGLEIK